jgi:hypothetical protein
MSFRRFLVSLGPSFHGRIAPIAIEVAEEIEATNHRFIKHFVRRRHQFIEEAFRFIMALP